MATQGLQSSIWAPKVRGSTRQRYYTPAAAGENLPISSAHSHPAPLPLASSSNSTRPLRQFSNGAPLADNGLVTSMWAPRDYAGRPRPANTQQRWTRTVSIATSISDTQSHDPSLDLGLPYEVQHCILAMIQRILEEGCYDFANRWIPSVLAKNKWTCPEAVELSTWKATLPTSLPADALTPTAKTSLRIGLDHAVRTRNAATHRHLCDNYEIRQKVSQAQDLMMTFSDTTRQSKFIHLLAELNDWEIGVQQNFDAAKKKLQDALQEIGERPMDDMDWTPNSVSLQEVALYSNPAPEELVDAMELD